MHHPSPHTLIFPAGMPAGIAYARLARERGGRVTGASSLAEDPARHAYDSWDVLPFVTAPGFDAALARVVRARAVTEIYTPHFVVARHLSQRLRSIAPEVSLATGRGPREEEQAQRDLERRMAALPPPAMPTGGRMPLTPLERMGLVRLVDGIPGMCGDAKIAGVCDALARAPSGDIVEIGSWWGRSAALLAWLGRRFGIGPVLCVDPWCGDAMVQGNAMLDGSSEELDPAQALRMFETNLVPLAQGRLNYLRARSIEAAREYGPGLVVRTEAFGATSYSGGIAVLHIDGNHAAEHVAADVGAWAPHVLPGGWIIFDDYEWAFGDGPRIVADRFIEERAAEIVTSFRAGPALLIQMKGADDAE